jgi:hypothetical protein
MEDKLGHDEQDMYPDLPFVTESHSIEDASQSPNEAPKLWYPSAARKFSMKTKGTYE